MDKVVNPSDSECHTPSSEPYKFKFKLIWEVVSYVYLFNYLEQLPYEQLEAFNEM
jgi:hypothetical protein